MAGLNKCSKYCVISRLQVFRPTVHWACPIMEPVGRATFLTLSISSAGQHRDGFIGSGQILDEFPGVLSLRRHGASHVSASGLSARCRPGRNDPNVTSEDGSEGWLSVSETAGGWVGVVVALQWFPPSTVTYTPPEQRSSLWWGWLPLTRVSSRRSRLVHSSQSPEVLRKHS